MKNNEDVIFYIEDGVIQQMIKKCLVETKYGRFTIHKKAYFDIQAGDKIYYNDEPASNDTLRFRFDDKKYEVDVINGRIESIRFRTNSNIIVLILVILLIATLVILINHGIIRVG